MRGKDVFNTGTSYPANYNIMELLICMMHKKSICKSITAVLHIMHMQDKIEKFHQDHLLKQAFSKSFNSSWC